MQGYKMKICNDEITKLDMWLNREGHKYVFLHYTELLVTAWRVIMVGFVKTIEWLGCEALWQEKSVAETYKLDIIIWT